MFSRDVLEQRGKEVLMNLVRSTCAHGVERGLCGKCCEPYSSCRALQSKARRAVPHPRRVAGQQAALLPEQAPDARHEEASSIGLMGREAGVLYQKFREVPVEQALDAADQKASSTGAVGREAPAFLPKFEEAAVPKAHDQMPTTSSSAELLHWVLTLEQMLKKGTQELSADFGLEAAHKQRAPRRDPFAGSMVQPNTAEVVIEGSPKQDTWLAGDASKEQKLVMTYQEPPADCGLELLRARTVPSKAQYAGGATAGPTSAEAVIKGLLKEASRLPDAHAEQKQTLAYQESSAAFGLEVSNKQGDLSKCRFAGDTAGPTSAEVVIEGSVKQAQGLAADAQTDQKRIMTYQDHHMLRSAVNPPLASEVPEPAFAGSASPPGCEATLMEDPTVHDGSCAPKIEVARTVKVFSASSASLSESMDAIVVKDPPIDGPAYVRVPRLEFM